MCVGVVGNLVASGQDFGNEMWIFLGMFADHKKGGASVVMIEEREAFCGMSRRRPVVDRDPDFLLIRIE
jgi:hypothetical protein